MNILQKHTAQFFGTAQTIHRSGKVIYTARGVNSSDLGLYSNGRQLKPMNYSTQRKAKMPILDRVLYR